jgi:4-amino-4-deoxy-L-arabinose transferase-like glycosyltransferase
MKKYTRYFPYILFILALVLAFVTRFYKLGKAPAGLYLDESAQGYNAFSILKTGKDEFGKSFPIVFRSFTDFKTPVYIYLIVPLIPIFGLNSFTVRFPSFLFSILTIPVIYLLIKKVSRKQYLALIVTLLLAISPWHILFGRTNFECNVALFFFLTGLYLFYVGLTKPKWLIGSALFFAIAIPSYHSQRIITPLTLMMLFFRFRKIITDKLHFKFLAIGLFIGLFISLPTLSVIGTPGFLARASGLNIFAFNNRPPSGYLTNYTGPLPWLINNNYFLSLREFSSLYISYLSPINMFILGDSGLRSSFPNLATFFFWQLPFYLYGLYLLFMKMEKSQSELKFLTIFLLIISPLPAAVTRDPYSTIRALPLVIPQIIIIGLAIQKLLSYVKNNIQIILAAMVTVILLVYSLGKLYSSVIILNEYYRAGEWDYGVEQVVTVINDLHTNLPIIFDNARLEPYSQIAFFEKYDPITFQQTNFEVTSKDYYINMNRVKDKKIGNITTRTINWERDLKVNQYLIGDELAISPEQIQTHHLTLIAEIKYPDQSVAFRIVKTNPQFTPEKI